MSELLCLGELLIDFVPVASGSRLRDVVQFERAAGGAPANVAVGFSTLGGKSGFVGKVGDDEFGAFLRRTLQRKGVDVTHLRGTRDAQTGLAFVSLRSDGERDFLFYRNPAADMLLRPDEVPVKALQRCAIFHFGSVSLISDPAREATLFAARTASESGRVVSFDPNFRFMLWPDPAQARVAAVTALQWVTVLKASEDELGHVAGGAGEESPQHAAGPGTSREPCSRAISSQAGILFERCPRLRLIAVTQGRDGCTICLRGRSYTVPGFEVGAVDTTGAGDGFTAGLLFRLARGGQLQPRSALERANDADWDLLPDDYWVSVGRFANAVGAIVVTKRGGIPSMPGEAEVRALLDRGPT